MDKKIGILIVAYNAEKTLSWVISRIPHDVIQKVSEIFVFDDASRDKTFEVGQEYKQQQELEKLNIYYNQKNQGYGGNQKRGYDYAIKKGYDIVVLLHGDGQYAPEAMPALLELIEKGEADMVFGTRMTQNPLQGGMPLYKYLGNKFLTLIENLLLGLNLSEYHSGYRVYSCSALKQIPYSACSNDFHFDTDIIIMFKEKGLRIAERPIPTYYGDEISHVKVISYGFNVLKSILEYKLHKWGIRHSRKFTIK